MSGQASVLEDLRRPEYTGENRCVPCTIVNVVIAAVVSAPLVALFVPVGVGVFALSLVLIYLRGYLVPGTPALTKRYLPRPVLELFDKNPVAERTEPEFDEDPTSGASADGSGEDGAADASDYEFETLRKVELERRNSVDPETFLPEVGALEPTDDGEEFRFTDAFADLVTERVEDSADDADAAVIARIFEADPDAVERKDRDYPAYSVDNRVRKWPSTAALALDAAADGALGELTDRWVDVPIEQRRRILESLRALHEACPDCGGAIELDDDAVVESCCGRYEVMTVSCADCGVHLREFDATKVGNREDLKGITP